VFCPAASRIVTLVGACHSSCPAGFRNRFAQGFTRLLAGATIAVSLGTSSAAAQTTDISFYYPVAVGGPVTKIIDRLAADFERENPGVKVKPIYSGTYQETLTKTLAAMKSGHPLVD
jgi:sn-glycerol 3-phosphate transport system substrate-binding protein